MFKTLLLVGVGGAVGSSLRFLTSFILQKWIQASFPWGTFVANLIGCVLIGILMGYFIKIQPANNDMKILLVTGFCGGYTTFSTFSFESYSMMQQGQYSAAIIYILLSVIGGLLAVMGGMALTK
jgi:CrcB protein